MLGHHWPDSSASRLQSVDTHRGGHGGPGGCGPHSWWRDMKRSAWGSKAVWTKEKQLYQNHSIISLVGLVRDDVLASRLPVVLWDRGRSLNRLISCLQVVGHQHVRWVLGDTLKLKSLRSLCVVVFMQLLHCTWGQTKVKKSETLCFKHHQRWISRWLHTFLSYLNCGHWLKGIYFNTGPNS